MLKNYNDHKIDNKAPSIPIFLQSHSNSTIPLAHTLNLIFKGEQ